MACLCSTVQWFPCSKRQNPSLHGEQLASPVGSGLLLPALTSCCFLPAQLLSPRSLLNLTCSASWPLHWPLCLECSFPTFIGSPSASVRSFPKVIISKGFLQSYFQKCQPICHSQCLYSLHGIHLTSQHVTHLIFPCLLSVSSTSMSSTGQGFYFFLHCCTPSA